MFNQFAMARNFSTHQKKKNIMANKRSVKSMKSQMNGDELMNVLWSRFAFNQHMKVGCLNDKSAEPLTKKKMQRKQPAHTVKIDNGGRIT